MKYRNTPTSKDIIGFDLFINWDEPIILCEGVFDAKTFKRNAIPLFGKTVMNNLYKKIIEQKVKTLYLALDKDALTDSIKITENFINNEIEVKLILTQEKDPSEIGFENLLYLLNKTTKTKFSDLMRLKLHGKTKKHRLYLGNDRQSLTYDCCMAAGNTIKEVKVVNQYMWIL